MVRLAIIFDVQFDKISEEQFNQWMNKIKETPDAINYDFTEFLSAITA